MKLLLDENLAPRLAHALQNLFPGSLHVVEVGLRGASDEAVWTRARSEGFWIVTKDSDFQQRSYLRGHPPKVVWIRLGNRASEAVEEVLRSRIADLRLFEADPDAAILVLD